MEESKGKFEINFNSFVLQLRGDIFSDLTTLQILNDSNANNTYSTKNYVLQNGIVNSEVPVVPFDFLKQREINKCFKSIIASLQDYMDKLIASIRLAEEKIIPTLGTTHKEIEEILQSKYISHLLDVSTDRSLNIPCKLETLLGAPENQVLKNSVQSYFDIRNGLEHHKGIAKTERNVTYKRIIIATSKGQEIIPPMTLESEEGIFLKTVDEVIAYDKGGNLNINQQQLDGIVLNILNFVIEPMRIETAKKINTPKSSC